MMSVVVGCCPNKKKRKRDGKIREDFRYRIYRTNALQRGNKIFSQILSMKIKVVILK